VVASPVLGLVVGRAILGLRHASRSKRAAAAWLTLYGASTLFGMVLGVAALFSKAPAQNMEVFIEPVLAILWGITFTGYFVVLWPLTYLTQAWVLGAEPPGTG
jgi:hypothetical protein